MLKNVPTFKNRRKLHNNSGDKGQKRYNFAKIYFYLRFCITTQAVCFKGHFNANSLDSRLSGAMFSDNIKLSNFEIVNKGL